MLLLSAALLFLGSAPMSAVTAAPCAYDRAAVLALAPEAFDQDLKGGWRPLADKPQCRPTAADLLRDYRRAHRTSLTQGQMHTSYWHEGQMRATAGQTDIAVPLLLAGVNPDGLGDPADYALGTVAFLQKDRPALQAARARLAATPQIKGWAEMAAQARAVSGRTPDWPPNLDVLDGFLACFSKSYEDAYASVCRTKPKG